MIPPEAYSGPTYAEVVEEDEEESTPRQEEDFWDNFPFTKRQAIGGAVVLLSLLWFFSNQGKEGKPEITKNVFTPQISQSTVETAKDQEEANFLLHSAQMQSGLLRAQATQFLGIATQFQNQKGHFCNGKPMSVCLRSFQSNRESEILALYLNDAQSGTKKQLSRIAQLTFEINAIEVALSGLGKTPSPAAQNFMDTVLPYPEVQEPPVVQFLQSFRNYSKKQQLQEQLNREKIEQQVADQQFDKCRQEGTKECF